MIAVRPTRSLAWPTLPRNLMQNFDTILEALVDMDARTEVLPKYGVFDKNGFRPC